ncbi:MAG: protein-export chaperone SecB [Firmicutes bacterium]|nr:protein-export chaperone SecB [Bacillota bacterium]
MQPLVNMQLVTNEISIKNNHLPDGQFTIQSQITRNIGVLDETHSTVELVLEILNTEEHPFPVDIRISLTGVFDISTLPAEAHDSFLKLQAIQIMYPYLRTMLTNITSSSLMPPIVLPIVDVSTLFPEDA